MLIVGMVVSPVLRYENYSLVEKQAQCSMADKGRVFVG